MSKQGILWLFFLLYSSAAAAEPTRTTSSQTAVAAQASAAQTEEQPGARAGSAQAPAVRAPAAQPGEPQLPDGPTPAAPASTYDVAEVEVSSGSIAAEPSGSAGSGSLQVSQTGSFADVYPSGDEADDTSPWRAGVFTGAFFPSPAHSLFATPPKLSYQFVTRYELGARAGYYPLRWLGLELEFMHARGAVRDRIDGHYVRADFNAYRAQLVGELRLPGVSPFVVVGGGALQALSRPLGPETQPAFHAGVGLNIHLSSQLGLRIDVRENISDRVNDRYIGLAFHEEAQLGLSFTPGATAADPPAATRAIVTDRDGDTVPDERDRCPGVAGSSVDGCPTDRDLDGVRDDVDECPRDAGPAPRGCPELDPDQDGVQNPCDACPDQPGTGNDGCPPRDADGDGLMGEHDRCPERAETKNGFDDGDGCPDELPEEVKRLSDKKEVLQFKAGSSALSQQSKQELTDAARVMRKFPTLRIEISGHASSEGPDELNERLSRERAEVAKAWLVSAGIEPRRMETRAASSREPIADNASPEGRQRNRRIEIVALPP